MGQCAAGDSGPGPSWVHELNGHLAALSRRPVALVTGAAGGIGAAIAVELARAGYDVALTAERPCDDTAELVAAAGSRVWSCVADLAEQGSAVHMVKTLARASDRLDLLVNNAGITVDQAITETDEQTFDLVTGVNLRSVWASTRTAVGPLRATGGCVVNVTSLHARFGMPGHSVYAATKGAVVAMTRQLAVELAPTGIRVNAVQPGFIEVPAYRQDPWYTPERLGRQIPRGRVGTPGDVARAVVFLASDAADYITGAILPVDGGVSATMPVTWGSADT